MLFIALYYFSISKTLCEMYVYTDQIFFFVNKSPVALREIFIFHFSEIST